MRISIIILCVITTFCIADVEVKRTNISVTPDGKLDETVWQSCPKYKLDQSDSGKITNPTTVQLAYDANNLYVAFICHESNMKDIANQWTHDEERDNSIWTDDCVEIFLDPWGARKQFYQVIVNTSGVIYDAFSGNTLWDADLKAGVSKHPDKWIAEIVIPFKDLKVSPKGGEVWLGNFCREEKPEKENTTVFPTATGFTDPDTFGQIAFEPGDQDISFLLSQIGEGGISANIHNKGDNDQPLRLILKNPKDGSVILQKDILVSNKDIHPVSFPYKLPEGTKAIDIQVTSTNGKDVIYTNVIPLTNEEVAGGTQQRVWKVENPLYTELLSDEPVGLSREGTIFWTHGMEHYQMRPFALQYGLRYVYDEFFKLLADNQLRPFANECVLTSPTYNSIDHFKKYGIKAVFFPSRSGGSEFKTGRYPFFCDPAVVDSFIKDSDANLKKHGDVIWAVSPGDEVYEHDELVGVELFATMKDKYPYIRQANEEVKTNYGGGIHGMPENLKDNNPYRWIAYRKWLNNRYSEIFKQLYQNTKAVNPNIKVISWDPIAFHHPYDFSRASEYCDIMVHQLYPSRDGNRATFGFITKLLVDLSGVEVWPCAHVEEYAASFRPEEVLELISQIFRNGGSGLDYYLCDTVGRRLGKKYMHMEYWGAPDRWQIEMALAAEVRKMNKLKFPIPDCAILYSCDSYAAQGRTPTNEVETAYTLLGPNAGSWFRFIDDYQIDRDKIKLSDYKVIYVPYAPYQRPGVVKKLLEYVKNGGILVSGDTDVFRQNTLGQALTDLHAELFGESTEDSNNAISLPAVEGGFQPTERTLGKGKVYVFSSNPFTLKTLRDKNAIAFFKTFQKQLGLKTDENIWRFQFPMDLIKPLSKPQGQCLTNNYIHWTCFDPQSIQNVELQGTYTYSLPPDAISDEGGTENVAFSAGDLTDRRKAPAAGNVDCNKSDLKDWIVRYKTTEPFDITFDLFGLQPLERITLFYSHSGVRPVIRIEGSVDGKTWTPMGSIPELTESADDVRDVNIPLNGNSARFVRVRFDKRNEGNQLTLSELELWGVTPEMNKQNTP